MSEHFDIAVIGTGPGGYIAALKAAQLGAKTAVVEKHLLGGTCLNYGCIPSKALLGSAELIHRINNAGSMGVQVSGKAGFAWSAIQGRKDKILKNLRAGVKGLFRSRDVTLLQGTGKIAGPGQISIQAQNGKEQTIKADKTIIAVGSTPTVVRTWGDDRQLVCTSDEALHWKELPQRLLIVGGGVIGCEFACMMNEYGVEVTVVEMMDELLPEMERSLGRELAKIFTKRGIKIHLGSQVESVAAGDGSVTAAIGGQGQMEFDKVLVAVGRRPCTENIGLAEAGIETRDGFVQVDENMRTNKEGYYCIGDANGKVLLAHAASAQAVTAVRDALGQKQQARQVIPWAVYTFPEVAGVGITTAQARQQDMAVRIGSFPVGHLGKAMAAGETAGSVTVIADYHSGKLLGVHMLGHNATEVVASATAMMTVGGTAGDLGDMVFAHPTIGEAVKEAAEDVYQAAMHLPPRKIRPKEADIL